MTVHFHVGKTPYTFTVHRREKDQDRQFEEVTAALVWYSLLPIEGERARVVLRRLARAER